MKGDSPRLRDSIEAGPGIAVSVELVDVDPIPDSLDLELAQILDLEVVLTIAAVSGAR